MNQQSSRTPWWVKVLIATFVALDWMGLRNPAFKAGHEFLRMLRAGGSGAVTSMQDAAPDFGTFEPVETRTSQELSDAEIRRLVESRLEQ